MSIFEQTVQVVILDDTWYSQEYESFWLWIFLMFPAYSVFRISVHLFGCAGPWLQHVGSSSLTRDGTLALSIGIVASYPLDHQGSSLLSTLSFFLSVCVCVHTCVHIYMGVSVNWHGVGLMRTSKQRTAGSEQTGTGGSASGGGVNGSTHAQQRGGLQSPPESVRLLVKAVWGTSALCCAQCWADSARFSSVSKVPRSTSVSPLTKLGSRIARRPQRPASQQQAGTWVHPWALAPSALPVDFPRLDIQPAPAPTKETWPCMFMFTVILLQ